MRRVIPRSLAARVALALVLVAAPGGGALAVAAEAGGDTSAVAINTHDGASVFKLSFQIRKVMGDTVDNQNAAVAYASCTACQTVAISIQVLLVGGDPSTFTPSNYAIAINQNCTLCDTLASAYQFAVGIGTKLKFTADGRRQIADIRRQLEDLRHSGLTGPEIQTRVDALMGQLSGVLSTQLTGVNEPAGDGNGSQQPPPDQGGAQPQQSGTAPSGTQTGAAPGTPPPSSGSGSSPDAGGGTSTTPGGTQTTPDGSGTSTTPGSGTDGSSGTSTTTTPASP